MKITFINPKPTQLDSRSLISTPLEMKQFIRNNPLLQERLEFTKKSFGALGLLTIAGLVPDNFEIEFFDENMERIDYNQHFDLVAIGGTVGQLNRALTICNILKKKNVPIIVGGGAATSFPDIYTRRGINIIVGEGELLFKVFLDDFLKNKVKPIYDNTVAPNHIDLKDSPIPRFDLAAKYPYSSIGIQISRGCPYNCDFCQVTKIFGNKYRHKPIDNIIEEIKLVKNFWQDKFFFLYDDNPFANREYTFKLFDRLYNKENINLGRWGANANVDLYEDQEMMDTITNRGPVSLLGLGLESSSLENLKTIGNKMKIHYLYKYEEAMAIFKKNNINPVAYFMFGYENSKPNDLEGIINFIIKNKVTGGLSRLTPLPGSTLYTRLEREYENKYGKIKKSSLGKWGVVKRYLTEKMGMSEDQIQKYLFEARSIIYSDEHFYADKPIPTLF